MTVVYGLTPFAHCFNGDLDTISETAGDRTVGCAVFPWLAGTEIHGVRMYNHKSGVHDVKITLRNVAGAIAGGGTMVKTRSVTGPGIMDILFDAPYTFTAADITSIHNTTRDLCFKLCVYKPGASTFTRTGGVTAAWHEGFHMSHMGPLVYLKTNYQGAPVWYGTGDVNPTSIDAGFWPLDALAEASGPGERVTNEIYDPTTWADSIPLRSGYSDEALDTTTGYEVTVNTLYCELRGIAVHTPTVGPHSLKATLWAPNWLSVETILATGTLVRS